MAACSSAWGIWWGETELYELPSGKPMLCPVALLPPPPQGLQQPRAPRALCLLLIYFSCKDEPGAFCLSSLPEPSREEVMEDLAGDTHAHQPQGPPTAFGELPGRRLRPPGGEHTGINKHLPALPSLIQMLF